MGKMGCWGLKKEEQNYISDVWEKWGRHIWVKGVLGITKKNLEEPRAATEIGEV